MDGLITMSWPQYLRHECSVGGVPVRLSPTETNLMAALLIRYPRITRYCDLIEMMYEDPDDEPDNASNTISVFIGHLRRKLGAWRLISRNRFGVRICQTRSEYKIELPGLYRSPKSRSLRVRESRI